MTEIPKRSGCVLRTLSVISAQGVDKNCNTNLLAYCKRLRINAGEVRSAAYCCHIGRLGQRTFPEVKGEENKRDGKILYSSEVERVIS